MQSVLAQVYPLQPTGAGRRRHGDHRVVVVLVVGNHRHLVLSRGEVVAHSDWILKATSVLVVGIKTLDQPLIFCPGYLVKVTFWV